QAERLTGQGSDGPGMTDSVQIKSDGTDVNEAPDAGADMTVSAAEDAADTVVLAAVSATDPDTGGGNDGTSNFEDLSYAITGGDPDGLFEIDAAGQISLAAGRSHDLRGAEAHSPPGEGRDGRRPDGTREGTTEV